jgi:hypothetical protein
MFAETGTKQRAISSATLILALSSLSASASAQTAPCNLPFTSPVVVPINGTLGGAIVDDRCEFV